MDGVGQVGGGTLPFLGLARGGFYVLDSKAGSTFALAQGGFRKNAIPLRFGRVD